MPAGREACSAGRIAEIAGSISEGLEYSQRQNQTKYCLVVDGQWMLDPLVPETVPNPFGGRNSVLRVVSREASHLAGAENLPLIMESKLPEGSYSRR